MTTATSNVQSPTFGSGRSINHQLSTINPPVAYPGDHHRRAVRLRGCVEGMGPGSLCRRHPELSCPSLGGESAARVLPALAGNFLRSGADLSPFVFGGACDSLRLLLVFIGASIAAKARGIDISCGCFGHVSDQLSFAWHLVLVFALLAGVVALWFVRDGKRSPLTSVLSPQGARKIG